MIPRKTPASTLLLMQIDAMRCQTQNKTSPTANNEVNQINQNRSLLAENKLLQLQLLHLNRSIHRKGNSPPDIIMRPMRVTKIVSAILL